MRRQGSITRWVDDRGFGFVTDDEGGEPAFLHISALPKRSVRPMVGDRISYDVRLDLQGRPQAVRVEHVRTQIALPKIRPSNTVKRRVGASRRRSMVGPAVVAAALALIALIAGFALFLLHPGSPGRNMAESYHAPQAFDRPVRQRPAPPTAASSFEAVSAPLFACEGKTHCSQMSSCDEAMFYLHNCPGSVTDGDGDGRPCEDQWCGH